MKTVKVLLETVHLADTFTLAYGIAMSTPIANEEWVLETNYEPNLGVIGDIRLYRNTDPTDCDDVRMSDGKVERVRRRGKYFGSIPAAKVKCYRFIGGEPDAEREGLKEEPAGRQGVSGRDGAAKHNPVAPVPG